MLLYLSVLDTEEEKDKFTEVYEQYRHFCWYVANQLLEDAQMAEDAVQETFLALTRHLDKVGDVESPATRKFLMTIVKSKAIDILRKRKPEQSMEESEYELPDPKQDVLGDYISRENYNALISCVLELDESYRVIFEYKYVHQLSDREIGELLDISPKLVNVRYYRARKKLQEMLKKEVAGRARTISTAGDRRGEGTAGGAADGGIAGLYGRAAELHSSGGRDCPEASVFRGVQSSPCRRCALPGDGGSTAGFPAESLSYGFNKIAACILVILVAGGILTGGYLALHRASDVDSTAQVETAAADMAEETAVMAEESAEDSAADGETGERETAKVPEQVSFAGQSIDLASEQEVSGETDTVKTLVSCPVLTRDAEEVKVTIGNMGEAAISYNANMELQVQVDGAWYVVPRRQEPVGQQDTTVVLEPGMAQDEELSFADYALDYDAEQYRVLTYVDGVPYSAQFRFESVEQGLEEALEE